jgi:predicted HAD superfamily Cof-like phosphohydrolase
MTRGKLSEAALMVREFHHAANHPGGMPRDMLRVLRSKLILEEAQEASDAISDAKLQQFGKLDYLRPMVKAAVAKELADLLVVTYGAADVFSIPLDDVLVQVHASNMTKDFSLARRSDGKVMKGDSYRPPDLRWV